MKKQKKDRKTRRGLPLGQAAPVADNSTPYGGKRFRTSIRKDEFTHPAGTRPTAVILDIDGTLSDWGSSPGKAMEFARRHHEAGDVLIVVTARDHEYSYASSFNWLMHNLPYPFVGPFMRSIDDPRYSSEFKREVAESLEAIYEIVGAADDNSYVLDMWKHWAVVKNRPDFDICECSYTIYADWRRDLPAKEYPGTDWNAYDAWEQTGLGTTTKHRQAGYSRWDEELFSEAQLDAKTERLDLEDQVWADYPDLNMSDIESMDIEVLRQMVGQARDEVVEAFDETAPLDVEEILDELGEEGASRKVELDLGDFPEDACL